MANTNAMYAKFLGAVFTFVGLLGFFMDPVIGVFSVNALHNVVHLLTGVLGLVFGFGMNGSNARVFNRSIGVVYALVAILGFVVPAFMASVLDTNMADHVLHTIVAIGSLWVGFGAKD